MALLTESPSLSSLAQSRSRQHGLCLSVVVKFGRNREPQLWKPLSCVHAHLTFGVLQILFRLRPATWAVMSPCATVERAPYSCGSEARVQALVTLAPPLAFQMCGGPFTSQLF